MSAPPPMLPATHLVPPPVAARRAARLLAFALGAAVVVSAIAPWQQSVRGEGAVVAFDPSERPVSVDAPVDGVVQSWHVQEGESVQAGQLLASLVDNDPQRLERLSAQARSMEDRVDRKADGVRALEASLLSARIAADAKIAGAEAKVEAVAGKLEASERKVEGARAKESTAARNVERSRLLAKEGLASSRELEVAERDRAEALAALRGAEAMRRGAQAELAAATQAAQEARSGAEAKLQELEGKLASARSEEASARASWLSTQSSAERQARQQVRAPRDGVVLRLHAAEGAQQVKKGNSLATLVPPRQVQRVALTIGGNDAALLDVGRPVRLQFEGWPAVQFVGWPSVASGTFGGLIDVIDAAGDGEGEFRVVVRPDPADAPWPDPSRLRPGVRAHGWVLLEEVRLGFELWRQFNGFPPVLAQEGK